MVISVLCESFIHYEWGSHCKLYSSSCIFDSKEPQTKMEISLSVMSAVWIEVYVLYGHRNSLSMRYGGVSGWGVERKCDSMVERYEKQSTMGMRPRWATHCFHPIWIFKYRQQHWRSSQRSCAFSLLDTSLNSCGAQRRDIMSSLLKHSDGMSFDTYGVLGSYVCHFYFCFCQRWFLKVTLLGIWNKPLSDNCHRSLWHNLDLVTEKKPHVFLNRWPFLPSKVLPFPVAEVAYTWALR